MALIARIKTWVSNEKVLYTDLNAEFDNVLDNLGPLKIDDYSGNTTLMQTQTDPGEVGTESPATTLAGELARLRKIISEISGETYWYTSPDSSIASIVASINVVTPDNRVISGRVRTSNTQALYLVANGAATTATAKGATTPLVYTIAGTQYSIITDTNITGLPTAPAANNTCLVNDAGLAGALDSKFVGEFGSTLIVDNMGTEITGLVGKVAAFKTGAEYFTAYVKSTTELTNVVRGNFFDSSDAPLPRVAISDNDTITLMKLVWIFAKTDLTLTFTATLPFVGLTQPVGPTANDYWFDVTNDIWKKYDGVSWVSATATYIGQVVSNSTVAIASRSKDFYEDQSAESSISVEKFTSAVVRTKDHKGRIRVNGTLIDLETSYMSWDMTLNLDSGITEAASTIYYCYITSVGGPVISDLAPQDRREDLLGLYHPFHNWRCVGQFHNDASSNIEAVLSYDDESESNFAITHAVAASALTVKLHASPVLKFKLKNSTADNGLQESLSILPGTSVVASSGSTLGTRDATTDYLLAYGISYAGRLEAGISLFPFKSNHLATSVAEGGAGAADNNYSLYARAARTTVPTRIFGKLTSSQATAGTWATAISSVINAPFSHTYEQVNLANVTMTVPNGHSRFNYLAVGGGGGGGGGASGSTGSAGGGGGGALPYSGTVTGLAYAETLTIVVGAGGAGGQQGGASDSQSPTTGSTGTSSTINATSFGTLTFLGGTGGGKATDNSVNAASGANSTYNIFALQQTYTGGAATGAGGGGGGAGVGTSSGGAGGVAGAGTAGSNTNAGMGGGGGGEGQTDVGGAGGTSAYFARTTTYSGGAGGLADQLSGLGAGGGGGGAGLFGNGTAGSVGSYSAVNAASATNNSGAGGGGGGGSLNTGFNGGAGGAGGSGRVYLYWDL